MSNFFMRFLISAFLLLSCGSVFAFSHENQLWIEPDAGRKPILEAIAHAHQEVDVVMYWWSDQKIAQALVDAANRGIIIKVLLEKAPYENEDANVWLPLFWKHAHIQWHWVPYENSNIHYFHQKTLIIDHREAWIMTLNFVRGSFNQTYPVRNFILVDQNITDVNQTQALFDRDWINQALPSFIETNLVVSPSNSRARLGNLIRKAQSNLEIYMDDVDDYQLIGDLADAAKRGVKVQMICGGNINDKAEKYLTKNGVKLKKLEEDSHLQNHAKVILADSKYAFIGSENLTQNSLEANRELGVIVENGVIIAKLKQQFLKDWN